MRWTEFRRIKSDETWFIIVQYRIKLSSASSSDLADLVDGYIKGLGILLVRVCH